MPSLVFLFIISSVVNGIGTTKRMSCWLFNFISNRRVINDKDTRTLLSVEGVRSALPNRISVIATVVSLLHRKYN